VVGIAGPKTYPHGSPPMSYQPQHAATPRPYYIFRENRNKPLPRQIQFSAPIRRDSTQAQTLHRVWRLRNGGEAAQYDASDVPTVSSHSDSAIGFGQVQHPLNAPLSNRDLLPSQQARRRASEITASAPSSLRRSKPVNKSNSSQGSNTGTSSSGVSMRQSYDQAARRKPASAHTNVRRLSFDHVPDTLSLGDSADRGDEPAVSELGANADTPLAEPDDPAAQRSGPPTRFSQILECIRRVPTALQE